MRKDLTGLKFGKLTAKSVVSRSRNGHIRWLCQCDCGREHSVLGTHLLSAKIKHCGCDGRSGIRHRDWGGFGDISGAYFSGLQRKRRHAKSRKEIEFNITIEYVWNLFIQQNKRCALSRLDLYFMHTNGVKTRNSQNASLDRINSSLGYIEGNVQWVHKDINLMKNKIEQSVFINYCKLVNIHSSIYS